MSSVPDTGMPSRVADLINRYCQEVDTEFAALIKAKGEPHCVLADRLLILDSKTLRCCGLRQSNSIHASVQLDNNSRHC